jgi:hypothetical protein
MNSKLATSQIYHMLSLDLPPWFFNTVNKLVRGFFWLAMTEARNGHCVVACDIVFTPKDLGGLGVNILKLLNHAHALEVWGWL